VLDPLDPPPERADALVRPPARRTWRDHLDRLADATGSTPGRLAVGAGAVAVGVALVLWLTRPAAAPPEVSLPFATTLAATAPVTSSTTSVPEVVVVHVAGAVQRPGVLRLDPGARVVDAVDAAGGLAPNADGARLNLAAPVADGDRVYVPAVGEEPPPVVPGGPSGGSGGDEPSGPLDLNGASLEDLDALPGIGPATAAAILEHRDRIGGFTSVDQLLDVRGIGEAKLEQLRPLVTV
jgi:competence protein ComEA